MIQDQGEPIEDADWGDLAVIYQAELPFESKEYTIDLPIQVMDSLFYLSGGVYPFYLYVVNHGSSKSGTPCLSINVWADCSDLGVHLGSSIHFDDECGQDIPIVLYGKVVFGVKEKLSFLPGAESASFHVTSMPAPVDIENVSLGRHKVVSTPSPEVIERFSRFIGDGQDCFVQQNDEGGFLIDVELPRVKSFKSIIIVGFDCKKP